MNRSQAKAHQRNAIAGRRRRLSLLLRSGMSQAEAAKALGCSEATVSTDLATMRGALNAAAAQDLAALIADELAALDADEAELRAALADEPGVGLPIYEQIGKIQDRRARWRGFEQAPKQSSSADLDTILREFRRESAAQ